MFDEIVLFLIVGRAGVFVVSVVRNFAHINYVLTLSALAQRTIAVSCVIYCLILHAILHISIHYLLILSFENDFPRCKTGMVIVV